MSRLVLHNVNTDNANIVGDFRQVRFFFYY